MTITQETVRNWRMRERAHYNGGKEWFGYGHQCIENPRLYRLDRYLRKDRSVKSEWQVDGLACADIDDAITRLNSPAQLVGDEKKMLDIIPLGFARRDAIKADPRYSELTDPFSLLHWLDRKGFIEWQSGQVRRRDSDGSQP